MSQYRNDDGFFSEFGEDRWIVENLPLPAFGCYVDVGCAHPEYANNCAFLRDRKWYGLSIDGHPRWLGEYETNFFCGVISSERVVKFEENDLLSRIGEHGKDRVTITLEAILNGFGIEQIDFLSIDLEGEEFPAFRTMDLARHRPKIIVGEYSTLGLGDDFRLRDYLLENGYRIAHQTKANLIYALI